MKPIKLLEDLKDIAEKEKDPKFTVHAQFRDSDLSQVFVEVPAAVRLIEYRQATKGDDGWEDPYKRDRENEVVQYKLHVPRTTFSFSLSQQSHLAKPFFHDVFFTIGPLHHCLTDLRTVPWTLGNGSCSGKNRKVDDAAGIIDFINTYFNTVFNADGGPLSERTPKFFAKMAKHAKKRSYKLEIDDDHNLLSYWEELTNQKAVGSLQYMLMRETLHNSSLATLSPNNIYFSVCIKCKYKSLKLNPTIEILVGKQIPS